MWKRPHNKYGNKVLNVDGQKYDSKKEYYYWLFLQDRQKKGEITNLRRQVAFEIIPEVTEEYVKHFVRKPDEVRTKVVQPAVHYMADFVYTDTKTGQEEVVDVKSEATRKDKVYILKKKMMRAFKHIVIVEV